MLNVAVSDHTYVIRPEEKTLPTCLLNFGHVPVFNDVLYCQIKENVSRHQTLFGPFTVFL